MSAPQKPARDADDRPAHDEWGVYDPEQAGFEAILRKLSTKKKAPAVPDQAKPVQPTAPQAPAAADEDNGIWMTPASALKSGTK